MTKDIYNQYKEGMLKEGVTPTVDDEIAIAINIGTWQKILEKNADQDEDLNKKNRAINFLQTNQENFDNYDLDEVIKDIQERYNINTDDRLFNQRTRYKKINPSKHVPNKDILSPGGVTLFDNVPNYQSYVLESWKDIPRAMIRGVDDIVFGLLGANKEEEDIVEINPETGYKRKQFVPSTTPFGPIMSPVPVESEIDILEAMTEGNPVPYKGIFKDNPNLADATQFTFGLLGTLPAEINLVKGGIRNIAGAVNVSGPNPLVNWARDIVSPSNNITNDYTIKSFFNRMRAKNILSKQQQIFDIGVENTIKQAKSDIMFTNFSIVGLYGAGQGLESVADDLEGNPYWQGFQIPALIFGTMMMPRGLFNQVSKVVPGMGGPSTFKKAAWFVTGGGDIDGYLTSVLGMSEEAVGNIKTFEEKLDLAKITNLEYKRLNDLGRQLSDLKKYDLEEYNRHVEFMDMVIEKRNSVGQNLAESMGYKTFDELSVDQPKVAEQLDIAIDALLESDSLRAQKHLLNKGNKIPAFANVDPRELQSAAQRIARQEASKRAILAESLKALTDKTKSKGAARDFLTQVENINDQRRGVLENTIAQADQAAALRSIELENAYYDGVDMSQLDLTDEGFDVSDLEGINDRFEFFEMFGYSPTAQSVKNLERGLTASGESAENIAARVGNFQGVKTPLASYGEESSNLFFGKFNQAKKEIDDIYRKARSDMEGRNVLISDEGVTEAFQNIITRLNSDPSKPARLFTGRMGNVIDFRQFYKGTAKNYTNNLAKNNDKDSLLQLIRDVDPALVDEKVTINVRNAKGELEPLDVPLTDDRVSASFVNNNFVKPIIDQGQILDTGIDLADIQTIRSNLMNRADSLYGTVEGKEFMDLADDWGIILEAGSTPYMNNPDVVTLIEANKKFAKEWAPLWKQDVGKKLLERGKGGTSKVAPHDIFRSFFDNNDPVASLKQFKLIFKDDVKATNLLKRGIARHIETGGTISRDAIVEMRQLNILSGEEITSLLNATGIRGRKALQMRIGSIVNNFQSVSAKLKGKGADRSGGRLIKLLADLPGNNPENVYNILANEFDVNDLKKAITILAANGYKGGGAQARRDLTLILAKPIQEKVLKLGNELMRDDTVPKLATEFKNRTVAGNIVAGGKFVEKQMKKLNLGKTADELEREEFLPKIDSPDISDLKENKKFKKWYDNPKNVNVKNESMPESIIRWQEELDSKALQIVLDEMGPQLKYLDPDHYRMVEDIFGLGVFTDKTTGVLSTSMSGAVRSMSVESIISRIYSINRGVVSPRYVATEAVVQLSRKNSQEILRQMLSDRKTPQIVLDVMRGKGLQSPDTKAKWVSLMRSWFVYDNEITDEQILDATYSEIDSISDVPRAAVQTVKKAKNILGSAEGAAKTLNPFE